jgi:2-deoxy-D-gluconate 3-dehydrogenase
MQGKVALVTGSSKGIGLAIARRLSEAGATVVLNGRSEAPLAKSLEALRSDGMTVDGEAFDACSEPAVKAAMRRIRDRHGRFDILVNNAGVLLSKTIFETTPDEWDDILRSNMTSAFVCSKAALEIFRAQGDGGRIIMIGSLAGQRGAPAGAVGYGA